jgi:hypothetical protein
MEPPIGGVPFHFPLKFSGENNQNTVIGKRIITPTKSRKNVFIGPPSDFALVSA